MIPWETLQHASGFFVDCTLLLGAIAAVIKFRLFNVLGYRWRSDLRCEHFLLPAGKYVFVANYTVLNTGQRPLKLQEVRMRVVGARIERHLLVPDEGRTLADRVMARSDPSIAGMFDIEPGERSIYTVRTRLDELDDVVFVLCSSAMNHRRQPAGYRGFYCKHAKGTPEMADALSTPTD